MDVFTAILLALLALSLFLAYVLLGGFLSGAGYQPTPKGTLDTMIEFAEPDPTKEVFDLGSGFGRIVIEVAQRCGARTTGVEVDPLKVWWSMRSIRKKGLVGKAKIVRGNLLDADLTNADIVFVFLWEGIMQKLREKAIAQMKPGSVVVSYYHKFHDWQPEREDPKERVYLYRIRPPG
jgi:ribosomal protein L11 methylase PrmA